MSSLPNTEIKLYCDITKEMAQTYWRDIRYIEDFPDFKIESRVGFLPKGKYNGLAEGLDTNRHRIQSKVNSVLWHKLCIAQPVCE